MNVRKRGQANGHVNGKQDGDVNRIQHPQDAKTDYSRWRMLDEDGRHTWHYLDSEEDAKEWPMTYADRWYLGLDTVGRIFMLCTADMH